VSFVLFWIFGGGGTLGSGAEEILSQNMNPATLVMLVPVVVMLFTAVKTRNIYKAINFGLILGTIVGLAFHLLTPSSILSVKDGATAGFLTDGINGMIATIT
ncbi:Na+/H+ antiporter NhaC family protein, partial [Clostridium sp. SL.3.18]|nr:Na+/H+ antiporter NhaC family protein [Clostridium sp. SL.3.18]